MLGEGSDLTQLHHVLQDPSLTSSQILDVQVHHPGTLEQGGAHIQQIQFATLPPEQNTVELQELQPVQLPPDTQVSATALVQQKAMSHVKKKEPLVQPPVGKVGG